MANPEALRQHVVDAQRRMAAAYRRCAELMDATAEALERRDAHVFGLTWHEFEHAQAEMLEAGVAAATALNNLYHGDSTFSQLSDHGKREAATACGA